MDAKIIHWCNNLRAISILGVIMIHVTAPMVWNITSEYWPIANFYDSLIRFSVPVFIALSGAFLLDKNKEYTIGGFLKKRMSRILWPTLFWGIVYMIYTFFTDPVIRTDATIVSIFRFVLDSILNGPTPYFWFIYIIIGLYLFVPIIHKWTKQASEKDLLYFLAIWASTMLFFLYKFTALDLTVFSGYIGFMVLGYYLLNKEFDKPKMLLALAGWLLLALGCAIVYSGTYYLLERTGEFRESFYNNLSPQVLFETIGVFLIFKYTLWLNRRFALLDLIAKYSFGIYFIHILIIDGLAFVGFRPDVIHPIAGIPLVSVVCLGCSLLIVLLMDRVPVLQKFSGKG